MKYSNLSKKELYELQKKFRRGIIKQEDIPENVIKDLEILYNEQIDYLNKTIEENISKINEIKKKLDEKKKNKTNKK